MHYKIKGFKMLKNRLIISAVLLVVTTACFASYDTEVIESVPNDRLVKILHLHEDVMLKLIHKTAKLEKELRALQKKVAEKSETASSNKNPAVSSKYDKEFRAYIEASKKE